MSGMLKLGMAGPAVLRLGAVEVTRAYLGDALIFASAAMKEFEYTGEMAAVTLYPGLYKLEVWGAEGGYRSSASYAGKGGYSVGTLSLTETTQVFVRAGGSGNTGGTSGGFNGGGRRSTYNGGGGASDIRIGVDDLDHRVIVAGGGGSDGGTSKAGKYGGGESGGDVGASGSANGYGTAGYGGTQTGNSGGTGWIAQARSGTTTNDNDARSGFGFGGNGVNKSGGYGGAGGGGWYGGTGRIPDGSGDDDGGGGGGSGFVWTGQNAPADFALTEAHYLSNARTVDGSNSFTAPDGTTETGHSGDGYVRITPVVSYTITVLSEDTEKGSVSGGGLYENGTQVTVTASPKLGFKLSGWYEGGTQVSADKNYTFTVSGDRVLEARFTETAVYTITASIDPAGSGTVTGAGQYQEGETVALAVEPADGYEFIGWQENGQTVSESETYTFVAEADRALVGVCEEKVSRLPEGYIEIEYVKFDESTDIGFGYYTNDRDKIVLDLIPNRGNNRAATARILIATSNANTNFFVTYTGYSGSQLAYSIGTSTQVNFAVAQNQRTILEVDRPNKTIQFQGTTTTYPKAGGTYNGLGIGSTTYGSACTVYSAKMYRDGQLFIDLVPCIDPNGAVGFYDMIHAAFRGDAGKGTPVAGPAV